MRCYHFLCPTCIDTEVAGWVVGFSGGWYPKTTGAVTKSQCRELFRGRICWGSEIRPAVIYVGGKLYVNRLIRIPEFFTTRIQWKARVRFFFPWLSLVPQTTAFF